LYSAILLDTLNLSFAKGKSTKEDLLMVEALENLLFSTSLRQGIVTIILYEKKISLNQANNIFRFFC
jgi:hypothetical protein